MSAFEVDESIGAQLRLRSADGKTFAIWFGDRPGVTLSIAELMTLASVTRNLESEHARETAQAAADDLRARLLKGLPRREIGVYLLADELLREVLADEGYGAK